MKKSMRDIVSIIAIVFSLISGVTVAQHEEIVLNGNDLSSYSFFDAVDSETRMYVNGENHTFLNSNYKFQLNCFKYLHENRGVNGYAFEFGEGICYMFNEFIHGDDSLLAETLEFSMFPQQFAFISDLKAYYLAQEKEGKVFEVLSGDIDHNINVSFIALRYMLNGVIPNDGSSVVIGSIKGLADQYAKELDLYRNNPVPPSYGFNTATYNYMTSIKDILEGYEESKADFKACLGEKFTDFDRIMNGVAKGYKWAKYEEDRSLMGSFYREQEIYQKMRGHLELNDELKIFGQYGLFHVSTDLDQTNHTFESFRSFTQRLTESLTGDEIKVFSLPQFYYKLSQHGIKENESLMEYIRKNDLLGSSGLYLLRVSENDEFDLVNDDFKFVVLNMDRPSNTYYTGREEDTTRKNKKYFSFVHFGADMAYRFSNFSSLNSALDIHGVGKLDNTVKGFGGHFTYYEPYFMYLDLAGSVWQPVEVRSDSLNIKVTGMDFFYRTGYPCFDNNIVQLAFYGGMGFSQMKLTESRFGTTTGTSFLSESANSSKTYLNPAFTLDVGVDLKLRVGIFGLEVKAGRLFDASFKSWRSSGAMDNSIKTSLGGNYVQLGGTFTFGIY